MNVLLDTHVALWAITDSPKLSESARSILESAKTTIWVSVASLWEITIEHSLGRGSMPVSGPEARRYFEESGFKFLSIEMEHVLAVQSLASHHHDPFDRILVAQALSEPMRLMTHDSMVAKYGDSIILI